MNDKCLGYLNSKKEVMTNDYRLTIVNECVRVIILAIINQILKVVYGRSSLIFHRYLV